MDNFLKVQSQLVAVVRNTQHALDKLHTAQRAPEALTQLPTNSYILCEYEAKKPSKYHTNLHGPYRVVSASERKSEYTVQHLATNKLYDYHAKLLREFKYDDNSSPYEAAKHDDEYDEVVEALADRFKSNSSASSGVRVTAHSRKTGALPSAQTKKYMTT